MENHHILQLQITENQREMEKSMEHHHFFGVDDLELQLKIHIFDLQMASGLVEFVPGCRAIHWTSHHRAAIFVAGGVQPAIAVSMTPYREWYDEP